MQVLGHRLCDARRPRPFLPSTRVPIIFFNVLYSFLSFVCAVTLAAWAAIPAVDGIVAPLVVAGLAAAANVNLAQVAVMMYHYFWYPPVGSLLCFIGSCVFHTILTYHSMLWIWYSCLFHEHRMWCRKKARKRRAARRRAMEYSGSSEYMFQVLIDSPGCFKPFLFSVHTDTRVQDLRDHVGAILGSPSRFSLRASCGFLSSHTLSSCLHLHVCRMERIEVVPRGLCGVKCSAHRKDHDLDQDQDAWMESFD